MGVRILSGGLPLAPFQRAGAGTTGRRAGRSEGLSWGQGPGWAQRRVLKAVLWVWVTTLAAAILAPVPGQAAQLRPGRPATAPLEPWPLSGGGALQPVPPSWWQAGEGAPGGLGAVADGTEPVADPGRTFLPDGGGEGNAVPLWEGLVPPPPRLTAQAAVLMDAASGQMLYARRAHQRRAPASTTKILTAIVALEYGDLDDQVTVSPRAASTEGSTMDLVAGERYTLRELLWGLMLESGNDAAVAIAEHISGSEQAFAGLMNQVALSLGLRNTHFTNPHGLHDPDHYTTAYDLALLTRYALANQYFARLVCQPEKILCRGAGDWVRILASTNRLLWYHEWIQGVKTGTTQAAGPCLVSSGEKDGRRLIAVVLDSDDRWADSEALLEWGFAHFQPARGGAAGQEVARIPVKGGAHRWVAAVLPRDLAALVPPAVAGEVQVVRQLPARLTAPVEGGEVVGSVALVWRGRELARVEVQADGSVPRAAWWRRLWPW